MTARPKMVFLVLDGAADSPSTTPTALEEARTNGLDELARHAVCGIMYPLGRGISPESDTAVLSLLGYNPYKYYTGRGPLEALGAGVDFVEGKEVAFRANFATINPLTREIIDRRVGRSLTTEEARKLASALDGIRLTDGYAKVRATVGHRAVVVLGSMKGPLSGMVSNTDPAYVRRGLISEAIKTSEKRIMGCKPLVEIPEAIETCRLVDEFTELAIDILRDHPVNRERRRRGLPEANAMLLRDGGEKLPRLPPFNKLHGFDSSAAVAEMPVEIGIAKSAKLEIHSVDPPSGDLTKDLPSRLKATLKALEKAQFIYVHLKGPDEPGHDGNLEAKKKAIELIDEYFIQRLLNEVDLDTTMIIVTSDHATPWDKRSHTGDPVPVMVSWRKIKDSIASFTERECIANNRLGTIDYGWSLISRVVEFAEKL